MGRISLGLLGLMLLFPVAPVLARDTVYHLSIQDVLQSPEYRDRVGDGVTFSFGDGPMPPARAMVGEFVSNQKTNSFGKPDEVACRWAMLSVLREFRERAKNSGATAVVNLVSYYRKETYASPTLYECHAGAIVAGVAMKGVVVKRQ
jgi:hypothetical protein